MALSFSLVGEWFRLYACIVCLFVCFYEILAMMNIFVKTAYVGNFEGDLGCLFHVPMQTFSCAAVSLSESQ